jgi:hypothetical protein
MYHKSIICRLDRIQLGCSEYDRERLTALGFRLRSNRFVRSQTCVVTYRRVSTYVSTDAIQLFVQHARVAKWLDPIKVTLVVSDEECIGPHRLRAILRSFRRYRLLTVELAFDISPHLASLEFVKRFGKFGKSKFRLERHSGLMRYGSRCAGKLVRCYLKPAIGRFRIELQFNSRLLRKSSIRKIGDFVASTSRLVPAHCGFYELEIKKVLAAITPDVSRHAIARSYIERYQSSEDLSSTLRYLRIVMGVSNPARFLKPLPLTNQLHQEANRWSQGFARAV